MLIRNRNKTVIETTQNCHENTAKMLRAHTLCVILRIMLHNIILSEVVLRNSKIVNAAFNSGLK